MSKFKRRFIRITHPSPEGFLLILLEYSWALIVVLNGNSVYHASAVRNYHLLMLSVVMTVVLLFANLLFRRIGIKKRNLMVAVGLCMYSLVYLAFRFNRMQILNFVYLFVAGLPSLYLLFAELHRKGRLMALLHRLSNVVCFFALISVFFWVFGVLLGAIQPNMHTRINWGIFDWIEGYWGLHFVIQKETTFGTFLYRNSGIFTEAPMLNLWVCLAMAIELFMQKRTSKTKILILTVTILTTLSTTGLIFIVLCFGIKYFDTIKKRRGIVLFVIFAVAFVGIPVAVYLLYSLLVIKSSTLSFAMRMLDYVAGFKLWWDYPLLGCGFGDLTPLMKYAYSPNGVIGFSNSVMAVLATGGIWMGILYYVPHLAAVFPRFTKSKNISCFGICFLYLFVTTIFFARYLAVVMIAVDIALLLGSKYSEKNSEI